MNEILKEPSSNHLYAFACLISLSNAGAKLIQLGGCKEAISILQDAVRGLHVFFNGTYRTHASLYDEIKKLEHHVIAANRTLASSMSSSSRQTKVRLGELALHGASYPDVKSYLQDSISKIDINSPIRIVNVSCDSLEMQHVELVSSIILFNFGMAKMYLHEQITDDVTKVILLESSRKLLSLSLASLRSQYIDCHDIVHHGLIVTVSARVLSNLHQISLLLGDINEVNTYRSALSEVKTIIQRLYTQYDYLCEASLFDTSAPAA